MATAFDTLKAFTRLKQSGFNEEQAEVLSEVFQEAQESHLQTLATKSDLGELKRELKDEMAKFRSDLAEVRSDLAEVRSELKDEMAKFRSDLTEVRSELKDEMARFRGELAAVQGDIKLLRWMIGFSLALSVALLWLLIRMQ